MFYILCMYKGDNKIIEQTWKFRQCYCDLIFSVKILVLQWSCNPRFRFPKRRWLPRALSKCTLGFEGCKQKWSLRIPRACSWKRRLLRHSQRELRIRLQNQKRWESWMAFCNRICRKVHQKANIFWFFNIHVLNLVR